VVTATVLIERRAALPDLDPILMNIAVIPARGGSKRLPRKNVRQFAGRPLLWYSIAIARSVPEIDRCIVSTDDPEIAGLATEYGAEVLSRPDELSGDLVPVGPVVQHVLERLDDCAAADAVVLLQPCCPLRSVALVRHAVEIYHRTRPHAVVSVSPSDLKAGVIDQGLFRPAYATGSRSQDLSPAYAENGAVYVAGAERVRTTGDLFGETMVPLITEPWMVLGDIDTEFDLALAEFLYERYASELTAGLVPAVPTAAVS
jgi:CMP-N-acetylneuraminic acid synthetase